MARNVGDLALLLSVMAGPDPRVPHGARRPRHRVRAAGLRHARRAAGRAVGRPRRRLRGRRRGRRGRGRVRRRVFAAAGATVVGGAPRPSPRPTTPSAPCAPGTFQARLRRRCSPSTPTTSSSRWPTTSAPASTSPAPTSPAPTPSAPPSPSGCASSSPTYDVLVLPVSQVPPFPADQEYPTEINGEADGDLPRLDARLLLHHRHRLPGDLRAVRHAPPTGCRSASSSSRRTARTGSCSRSRRRSRRS